MKGGRTLVSAQRHWDITASIDWVKWENRDVTVRLGNPGTDENCKAAYARRVNDSFWLLAPLKLKDRGVQIQDESGVTIDGAACEVLRLIPDKAGLMPNEQYRLYLDPDTHLSSYEPDRDDKAKASRFSKFLDTKESGQVLW